MALQSHTIYEMYFCEEDDRRKMNGEQLSVDVLKNEYVSLDFLICRMLSSWLDMFETFGSSPCQHTQSHWLKRRWLSQRILLAPFKFFIHKIVQSSPLLFS